MSFAFSTISECLALLGSASDQVITLIRMTEWTVGLSRILGANSISAPGIFAGGDWFKVIGIYAASVLA